MSRDQSALLAFQVTIVYRTRRCGGNVTDVIPLYYTKTVPLSSITLSDPNAPQGLLGQVLATKVIRSTALALYSTPAGPPTNQATLDALAKQIAQDYYDKESSKFDVMYNGVIVPAAGSLIDLVEYTMDSESMFTRVRSRPWNWYPEEMQHGDGPNNAACLDNLATNLIVSKAPGYEVHGPPATCTGGGAKLTATVAGGKVTGVTVVNGGSGYTSAPTIRFSARPWDGTGATATATIASGAVTGVTVTAGGSGYNVVPVVSADGGGTQRQVTRYLVLLEIGRLRQYFVSMDSPS